MGFVIGVLVFSIFTRLQPLLLLGFLPYLKMLRYLSYLAFVMILVVMASITPFVPYWIGAVAMFIAKFSVDFARDRQSKYSKNMNVMLFWLLLTVILSLLEDSTWKMAAYVASFYTAKYAVFFVMDCKAFIAKRKEAPKVIDVEYEELK